jgi:hypothetical protein
MIFLQDKSQKSNNDDNNYYHDNYNHDNYNNDNYNHDNDPRADNIKRAARIFLQEKMQPRFYAIHK